MDAKKYNMADVGALIALHPTVPTQDEVRGFVLAASDVPPDRADFCASELVQAVANVRGAVGLWVLVRGEQPTHADMAECFAASDWTDDDKKVGNYSVTVQNEDGSEVVSAKAATKLD